MGLHIERTEFHGWQEAYRLRLGQAEMVVVTEIGPRILSFSVDDGPNLLFVDQEAVGRGQGDADWHVYARMARQVDPIGRNYVTVDTSQDLRPAVTKLLRLMRS